MYSLPSWMLFFANKVVIPRIKKILEMFAPKTLPSTISGWPLVLAIIPETNSGSDVPTATMTTPTINGESFRESPIRSAASVKYLDAKMSKPRLPIKINKYCSVPMLSKGNHQLEQIPYMRFCVTILGLKSHTH